MITEYNKNFTRIRTNQNLNHFYFILIGFITEELQFFGKKKMEKACVKQHLKPVQIKEILISPLLSHHEDITDFKMKLSDLHVSSSIYTIQQILINSVKTLFDTARSIRRPRKL